MSSRVFASAQKSQAQPHNSKSQHLTSAHKQRRPQTYRLPRMETQSSGIDHRPQTLAHQGAAAAVGGGGCAYGRLTWCSGGTVAWTPAPPATLFATDAAAHGKDFPQIFPWDGNTLAPSLSSLLMDTFVFIFFFFFFSHWFLGISGLGRGGELSGVELRGVGWGGVVWERG